MNDYLKSKPWVVILISFALCVMFVLTFNYTFGKTYVDNQDQKIQLKMQTEILQELKEINDKIDGN